MLELEIENFVIDFLEGKIVSVKVVDREIILPYGLDDCEIDYLSDMLFEYAYIKSRTNGVTDLDECLELKEFEAMDYHRQSRRIH